MGGVGANADERMCVQNFKSICRVCEAVVKERQERGKVDLKNSYF